MAVIAAAAGSDRGGDCLLRTVRSLESAESASVAFATELVGPEPGQLERLRALPAKELAEAYANKRVGDSGWQGFYPVIDPSEDVIPASPFEIFRQGGQARVPMMVGSNTDEGSLLAPMAGLDSGAMWSPNPALPESSGAYGGRGPELAAMYPGLASGDTRATADLIGDAFGQYAPTLARHSPVVSPNAWCCWQVRAVVCGAPRPPQRRASVPVFLFPPAPRPQADGRRLPRRRDRFRDGRRCDGADGAGGRGAVGEDAAALDGIRQERRPVRRKPNMSHTAGCAAC